MSTVFLSPSLQENNPYITGNGSEAFFMRKLSDAVAADLLRIGVPYETTQEGDTIFDAIGKSNAYRPTLHVALHSNAAPDAFTGQYQGPEIYYFKDSAGGRRAAEAIAQYLAQVYPYANTVQLIPTDQELAELVRTKAPSVFIEVAYHDNPQDADWIENNISQIAGAVTQGVADYFSVPYVETDVPPAGRVRLSSGTLNVRSTPSENGTVIGSLRDGDVVLRLQSLPGWDYVRANDVTGYTASQYIVPLA